MNTVEQLKSVGHSASFAPVLKNYLEAGAVLELHRASGTTKPADGLIAARWVAHEALVAAPAGTFSDLCAKVEAVRAKRMGEDLPPTDERPLIEDILRLVHEMKRVPLDKDGDLDCLLDQLEEASGAVDDLPALSDLIIDRVQDLVAHPAHTDGLQVARQVYAFHRALVGAVSYLEGTTQELLSYVRCGKRGDLPDRKVA